MIKTKKVILRAFLSILGSERNIVRLQQKRVKHQIEIVKELISECDEEHVKMMLGKLVLKLMEQEEELKIIKKKYPLFGIKI